MKKTLLTLLVIAALLLLGWFLFMRESTTDVTGPTDDDQVTSTDDGADDEDEDEEPIRSIGESANGNEIRAYTFGDGDTKLLFVGGIHGGYSWNTSLLAFELIDALEAGSITLSDDVEVTVVPVVNPDGLDAVVGTTGKFAANDVPAGVDTVPGRFNGNGVDLNRNFDCDWQAEGVWQQQSVSGGTGPFSEPEAAAMRTFVETYSPDAAVVFYSSAGGVFASNCHDGVSTETREILNVYANASGYAPYESYDFYEITGDFANWLASRNTPAISVLLTDHTSTEWTKNRAGIEALLAFYADEA